MTEKTPHPVCPYCGHTHTTDNFYQAKIYFGNMGCRKCGAAFPWSVDDQEMYTTVKYCERDVVLDPMFKTVEHGDPGEDALDQLAKARLIIDNHKRNQLQDLNEFEYHYFMSKSHADKLVLWEEYLETIKAERESS